MKSVKEFFQARLNQYRKNVKDSPPMFIVLGLLLLTSGILSVSTGHLLGTFPIVIGITFITSAIAQCAPERK